jgi:hypothetical protein
MERVVATTLKAIELLEQDLAVNQQLSGRPKTIEPQVHTHTKHN